jgi:acyl-CoA thioesterase
MTKMMNPQEIRNWMYHKFEENAFMKVADINIAKVECGYCEMTMDVDPKKHGNRYGAVHGGALFTLADTAMGAACYSIGAKVVTLSSSINFIRNTMNKEQLLAKASLIHVGRSTIVCRVEIYGPDGRKMVDVTGTMFVVGRFDEIPEKW